MSQKQPLTHKAEELGQSRPLTKDETMALIWLTLAVATFWGAPVGVLVGVGIALFWDYNVLLCTLIGAIVGWILVSIPILIKGVHEQLDGLRSWREIRSYAAPQPEPEPIKEPSSPILIHPHGGDPYLMDRREPLMLPDGRKTALGLNPQTLAVVLREIVERHDGKWSRDRLMDIKVDDQRITRRLYREFTQVLTAAGFLQKRPTGGYEFPHDIQCCADLLKYFPGLPEGRQEGRKAGN